MLFPSEGCWEITARVSDASLTFVILVAKKPFEILYPLPLPEGMHQIDSDITGLPHAIRLIYGFSLEDKRKISVETVRGSQGNHAFYPDSVQQVVSVRGQPGVCVQGMLDEQGRWQVETDTRILEWTAEGFIYRIRQTGLGLDCEALLRIVGPIR
jgi:hypothetical protein